MKASDCLLVLAMAKMIDRMEKISEKIREEYGKWEDNPLEARKRAGILRRKRAREINMAKWELFSRLEELELIKRNFPELLESMRNDKWIGEIVKKAERVLKHREGKAKIKWIGKLEGGGFKKLISEYEEHKRRAEKLKAMIGEEMGSIETSEVEKSLNAEMKKMHKAKRRISMAVLCSNKLREEAEKMDEEVIKEILLKFPKRKINDALWYSKMVEVLG